MKRNIALCVIFLLIFFSVPFIVNESYQFDDGYKTLIGAEDMLSYVGTIISAVATLYISGIAIKLSKNANEISDRALKLQEIDAVPSLSVVEEKTKFVEYKDNTIHFRVYIKNISKGIVDIKSVSDLHINLILSDISGSLTFSSGVLDFPTLLPNQEKQIDFSINKHNEEIRLCDTEVIQLLNGKLYFNDTFEIVLGYKDANTTYKETVKLNGFVEVDTSDNYRIKEQEITRSDYKLEQQEKI